MSWSDIFFGNPEKRENLIRKNQELKNLMENNFRATNKLIAVLNKHLGYFFREITLNEKADVKQNCDVIIERIREIQAAVQKIDQELKTKLEPTLYEKLKKMDLKLSTSDHARIVKAFFGVGEVGRGEVVSGLLKSREILENIVQKHSLLQTTVVASVAIGGLYLGLKVILGKIERDQLEHDLKEYDRVLAEFKPASEEYQDKIFEVMAKIKMIKKKF